MSLLARIPQVSLPVDIVFKPEFDTGPVSFVLVAARGQELMSFVDDREDINSICLTAVQLLLDNYSEEVNPSKWQCSFEVRYPSSCRPEPQRDRPRRGWHVKLRRQGQVDKDGTAASLSRRQHRRCDIREFFLQRDSRVSELCRLGPV